MTEFDRTKPLAFFHVPKTGGSALNSAIQQSLKGVKIAAKNQDRSLFGAYDDFATWRADQSGWIILSPDQLDQEAKYVSGHIALSTTLSRLPDAQFITLLREPVSRLLSHWVYWREVCEGNVGRYGSWADRLRLAQRPLGEFLKAPAIACQTDNVAVRMLLWPNRLIPQDDFIAEDHDDELVRQAMDALDRFALVGLYEDKGNTALFEAFLDAPLPMKKENETAGLSPASATMLSAEISEETTSLLLARCRLDSRVWRAWAEQRGLDADHLFLVNLLKNVSRFSILSSGLMSAQRARDQKIQMLEQALARAQQVNNMLVEKMSETFMKPA